MAKEDGYIWITDDYENNYFSMSAPQSNRSWCYPNRPSKDDGCKKCKDSIKNERIIQVAVAVNNANAQNFIDSTIYDEECCMPPVMCPPCNPGPCCPSSKKFSNSIENEKILQVAVAVDDANAQNYIDSTIGECEESGLLQPVNNFERSTTVEGEKNVVNKQFRLNSLDGDFNLLISKDGEISINGLKIEE